jgi:hypothetical protein
MRIPRIRMRTLATSLVGESFEGTPVDLFANRRANPGSHLQLAILRIADNPAIGKAPPKKIKTMRFLRQCERYADPALFQYQTRYRCQHTDSIRTKEMYTPCGPHDRQIHSESDSL